MSLDRKCRHCQNPIPEDIPADRCPLCVLAAGLGADEAEAARGVQNQASSVWHGEFHGGALARWFRRWQHEGTQDRSCGAPAVPSLRELLEPLRAGAIEYTAACEPLGPEDSVRATLEQAAARMEGELVDDPGLEADLASTIGAAWLGLGESSQAERMYRRAVSARRRLHGCDHEAVAAALYDLGVLLESLGRCVEAESVHRQALHIMRRLAPRGDAGLKLVRHLHGLARTLVRRNALAETETLLTEIIAIHKKALGPDHPCVTKSLRELGQLCAIRGDLEKEEPLDRAALEIQMKVLGAGHTEVARSLIRLAELEFKLGHRTYAKWMHEQAIATLRRVLGDDCLEVRGLLRRFRRL
jgi:tetratricopeptide (TPR) repeat protein